MPSVRKDEVHVLPFPFVIELVHGVIISAPHKIRCAKNVIIIFTYFIHALRVGTHNLLPLFFTSGLFAYFVRRRHGRARSPAHNVFGEVAGFIRHSSLKRSSDKMNQQPYSARN